MPGSEFVDGTWIVRFAADEELAGRVSSAELRSSLNQTF
jgi:hypothetical protein